MVKAMPPSGQDALLLVACRLAVLDICQSRLDVGHAIQSPPKGLDYAGWYA